MRTVIAVVVLFMVLVSMGFAATEEGPEDSSRRVLLATEHSRYKAQLFATIREQLLDGETFVRSVDHRIGELDEEDPDDYSVVVITSPGIHDTLRPWINNWLATHDTAENIIVYSTWGNVTFKPDLPELVDSVTSASGFAQIDDVADDLVERIQARLDQ